MPVDYMFPTLRDSPHQTRMEVSVAAMQKRLKEAFAVARDLTSQEAAKHCIITIARLELLPYSLGMLLWFVPMALWASER